MVCRRAAHFAHFGAEDEEEEDGDNLHTGGTEVCLLLDEPHHSAAGRKSAGSVSFLSWLGGAAFATAGPMRMCLLYY